MYLLMDSTRRAHYLALVARARGEFHTLAQACSMPVQLPPMPEQSGYPQVAWRCSAVLERILAQVAWSFRSCNALVAILHHGIVAALLNGTPSTPNATLEYYHRFEHHLYADAKSIACLERCLRTVHELAELLHAAWFRGKTPRALAVAAAALPAQLLGTVGGDILETVCGTAHALRAGASAPAWLLLGLFRDGILQNGPCPLDERKHVRSWVDPATRQITFLGATLTGVPLELLFHPDGRTPRTAQQIYAAGVVPLSVLAPWRETDDLMQYDSDHEDARWTSRASTAIAAALQQPARNVPIQGGISSWMRHNPLLHVGAAASSSSQKKQILQPAAPKHVAFRENIAAPLQQQGDSDPMLRFDETRAAHVRLQSIRALLGLSEQDREYLAAAATAAPIQEPYRIAQDSHQQRIVKFY